MVTYLISLERIRKDTRKRQTTLSAHRSIKAPYSSTGNMKLHQVLHHLVTTLTKALTLDDMLQALATLILEATGTDVCLILLTEKTQSQLRIHTSVPDLHQDKLFIEPVEIDPVLWQYQYEAITSGHLPPFAKHELAALNPLKNVLYETLLPIPLIAGNDIIGLINCYASTPLHYQEDDQLMLLTIANQAALAIKHRLYVEEEAIAHKARSKAFIDDLLSANPLMDDTLYRRAHMFGLDLTRPHAVALIEITDSNVSLSEVEPDEMAFLAERHLENMPFENMRLYEKRVEALQQRLQEQYPDSFLTEREGSFVCLFCPGDDSSAEQFAGWLESVAHQIQLAHHVRLRAGVSNLCESIGDYRRGYAEAREALDIGASICHERDCVHFNALGAYRYIYHFAHTDVLRDHYQEQITAIADYDQRKKTTLLDTLEAYLECGCNIARAATQLDIHRNTLLQRMERVQKLCTLDLEQIQNRLPLLIALKVHKLRTYTA